MGKYLQDSGVIVIPTIRASTDERSLEWYLDGVPKGGIVMISSMWARNKEIRQFFKEKEYAIMYEKIEPCKVFLYGNDLSEELPGNIDFIPSFTKKRFDR